MIHCNFFFFDVYKKKKRKILDLIGQVKSRDRINPF
jgi:hypothetical protein